MIQSPKQEQRLFGTATLESWNSEIAEFEAVAACKMIPRSLVLPVGDISDEIGIRGRHLSGGVRRVMVTSTVAGVVEGGGSEGRLALLGVGEPVGWGHDDGGIEGDDAADADADADDDDEDDDFLDDDDDDDDFDDADEEDDDIDDDDS